MHVILLRTLHCSTITKYLTVYCTVLCFQASFFIYEKIKVEGFAGYDDVRLRTAVRVPRSAIGQLIGKGGRTVRDIQQSTGCIIKLPTDLDSSADDTFVYVYGNFISTQVSTKDLFSQTLNLQMSRHLDSKL